MTEVVLADGRVLGIEAVTPAESMKLAEGTRSLSGNRGWCSMALIAASVRSIDGIPRPFPTHKKHIEALLKNLDEQDISMIRAASLTQSPKLASIDFKKLSPYEILKIYELAEEFNDVPGWFGPAVLAASVRKIDGREISFPESQNDLFMLVDELGLSGLTAASIKMKEALDVAETKSKALETAAKN